MYFIVIEKLPNEQRQQFTIIVNKLIGSNRIDNSYKYEYTIDIRRNFVDIA